MNKQQLAAKIWESANQMRSKIEANEYKDYILGFIFYKYLSDKQVAFAKSEDFSDEDLRALSESDGETVGLIKGNIGYADRQLPPEDEQTQGRRRRPEGARSGRHARQTHRFYHRRMPPLHLWRHAH